MILNLCPGNRARYTRKFNKEMRGYYTPFHAEAFGSIAEMERTKPELLRDILSVSPHTGSDQVS